MYYMVSSYRENGFEYLLIIGIFRALRELCVTFYYPVSNFIKVNSFLAHQQQFFRFCKSVSCLQCVEIDSA